MYLHGQSGLPLESHSFSAGVWLSFSDVLTDNPSVILPSAFIPEGRAHHSLPLLALPSLQLGEAHTDPFLHHLPFSGFYTHRGIGCRWCISAVSGERTDVWGLSGQPTVIFLGLPSSKKCIGYFFMKTFFHLHQLVGTFWESSKF